MQVQQWILRAGMWHRLPGYNRKEGSTAGTQTGNCWSYHTMGFPVHPLPTSRFLLSHLLTSVSDLSPILPSQATSTPPTLSNSPCSLTLDPSWPSPSSFQIKFRSKQEVINQWSVPLKRKTRIFFLTYIFTTEQSQVVLVDSLVAGHMK